MIASAGVVALAALAVSGSVATASSTAKSGKVQLWVVPSSTGATSAANGGKVVLTGAIGDYGDAQKVNAAGKPTKKGSYRLVKLKKGTILVDLAKFVAATKKATPAFNPANCSVFESISGIVTIVSGTGAYHGVTGSVTLTARSGGILPLENGKCTTKTTTPALATYTSITGSGTVTLP